MSEGITNFLQNSIDLSGYFPAYEILEQEFTVTENQPNLFDFTLTLTRNKNNVTNYIVLPQTYLISSNFSAGVVGRQSTVAGIYKKTSSTFSATIDIFTTSPALNLTAKIWFVVIYPYTTIQPLINSLNYSDSSGNIINFIPQYMTSSLNVPNNINNISLNISLSDKSTSRTDYVMFGSFYDSVSETSGINATTMQQILYYTPTQTNTLRQVALVNRNLVSNIKLETLVLYPVTISTNNYTSNYNVEIGNTNYNLSKLFPLCEFFPESSFNFVNTTNQINFTYTLNRNFTNTTNYAVLASFVYSSAGTGGTYDPWEAVDVAGNLIISNQTSTSFRVSFDKNTGDNWNGGIRCLVIYY